MRRLTVFANDLESQNFLEWDDKNQPIPAGGLNHERFNQKNLEIVSMGEPIASNIVKANAKISMNRDLSLLTSTLEKNVINPLFGVGIQALSIKQVFEPSDFKE